MTKKKKITAANKSRVSTQITANIGLFHVCYELSRRGFNVVPTSRNTRAVDLIVGSADFRRHKTVQVKANRSSNKSSPEIDKTDKLKTKEDALKEASLADFWVHVLLSDDYSVEYVYVWKGNSKELILKNKSSWFFPTQRAKYREEWKQYKDNWELIENALK